MKHLFLIALLAIAGCNQQKNYPKAENALDAAREFIDAALKGDFNRAAQYMTHDAVNEQLLQTERIKYEGQLSAVKKQLGQSVINIIEIADLNESETIVNYSNSFDKVAHKIKTKKINGNWLVDLH